MLEKLFFAFFLNNFLAWFVFFVQKASFFSSKKLCRAALSFFHKIEFENMNNIALIFSLNHMLKVWPIFLYRKYRDARLRFLVLLF